MLLFPAKFRTRLFFLQARFLQARAGSLVARALFVQSLLARASLVAFFAFLVVFLGSAFPASSLFAAPRDGGKGSGTKASAEDGSTRREKRDRRVSEIGESWIRELRGNKKSSDKKSSDRKSPDRKNSSASAPHKTGGKKDDSGDPNEKRKSKGETRFYNPGNSGKTTGGNQNGDRTQKGGAGKGVFAKGDAGVPDKGKPGASGRLDDARGGVFAGNQKVSFVSLILRFVGFLALMLGAFYLIVRYIKSKTGALSGDNDLIQIIASMPLVQGKFIQVVDLAGKLLILGVSDAGVRLITQVDDARTADRIRLWQSRRTGESGVPEHWTTRLTRVFRGAEYRFWNRGAEKGGGRGDRIDFEEILRAQGGTTARLNESSPAASPAASRDVSGGIAPGESVRDLPPEETLRSGSASDPYGEEDFFSPQSDPAEDRLREKLRIQRRRIASLNRDQ